MSDDKKKDKKGEEREREPPTLPSVSRPDLFAWLENLFAPEDPYFPLSLELRQVSGRGCAHMGEGILKKWQHSPGEGKPGKGDLVKIANEFSGAAQDDCNGIGQLQRYAVFAYHPKKHESWFDRKILRLYPKDGVRREDEDDDGELKGRSKLIEVELDHFKFKHRQVDESTANLLDHYSGRLEKVEGMLDRQMEKFAGVMDKVTDQFVKFMSATETALSQAAKRKSEAEMELFKMEMLRKGANLVESVVPPALNAALGQKVLPEAKSLVATTCEIFLNNLTEPERVALLGVANEQGGLAKQGIFTEDQVRLFIALAQGQVSDDRIDDFLEGGALEITAEQYMRAVAAVPPEKFAGLMTMVRQRQELKKKAS